MRVRRGISMMWLAAMMTGLLALMSLAVDYGRVQLAKSELRRAADAAARAGASYLGDITATQSAARTFAADNACLGTPVAIDMSADVEFGNWDKTNRTFTPVTGTNRLTATSLRVTCKRTTDRNNAVPLMFGWVIGKPTCDVKAFSVVTVSPQGYGLVGINSIKMSGNSSMSYWSATGTVAGNSGNIASNGDITSSGSSNINGTVFHMPGKKVTGVSAKEVKDLTTPLNYPTTDPTPYSKTYNDNSQIPAKYVDNKPNFSISSGQTLSIPGGVYVFQDFKTSGGSSITFTGPTTIYYYGNFSMSGSTTTASSLPQDLKIVAINKPDGKPPGDLTISGTSSLQANIYAPGSDITLSGSGSIYGSVVGKTVNLSGSSDIYYDLGLVPPGSSAIALVQ